MTLGDIIQTVLPAQLILLFLMTCWLFVLVCPREMFPWLVAILVPVWCAIWWLMARPVPTSDNWAFLGHGLFALALLATLVTAGLRDLVAAFAKRQTKSVGKLDWGPVRTSTLATIIATIVLKLGPIMAHQVSVRATLIFLLAVLAGSVVLSTVSRSRPVLRRRAATIACILSISLPLIAIWPFTVAESARSFARGRPYCILVADGGYNDRLATSRWDLSPLIMRAYEGRATAANRHGFIVLGEGRFAHWSYMGGEFVTARSPNLASYGLVPVTRCTPVPDFANRLPWF